MINVVIFNITLIVFDLTYLRLRPYYFSYIPQILEIYDPILGIEPHRMTRDYTGFVDELTRLEAYKEKEILSQEIKTQLTHNKELIQEIIQKYNSSELANFQKELENTTSLKEPFEQYNLTYTILKKYFQLHENKISFEEYTKVSKSLGELAKLITAETEEGRAKLQEDVIKNMDQQMIMIIEENPFSGSAQTHLYKEIQEIIKLEYNKNITPEIDFTYKKLLADANYTRKKVPSTAVAFAWYWRNSKTTMREKLDFFNTNMRPKFDLNYYRILGMDGKPLSHFWKIDAPFFTFFLLEFLISWYLAIRKKRYIAWFLYPLYHWYDALGLVPLAEFRLFRLLRVYSMFLMLQQREYATFGNDVVTRTLRDYSNIIKEELSDMVTIQILTDSQNEIRSGSSMDVVTNAIDSNRAQIKSVIIKKLSDSSSLQRISSVISELLSISIHKNNSFTFIPVDIKEKLARDVVQGIFDLMANVSTSIVQTEATKATIEKLIDIILDEVKISAEDPDLNKLNQDITIDLLENVKKQVAVKKWVSTIDNPFDGK
jgi:hypothetical protein